MQSDGKGDDSKSGISQDSQKEICNESACHWDNLYAVDDDTSIETTVSERDSTLSEEKNAFIIEVFAMQEDIDERFGFDLLEVSFDVFPELEYCVLSLPSHIKPFPLLEHFSFVSPRSNSYFEHCLYAVHRSSVKGNLFGRHAYLSDMEMIEDLVKKLPNHSNIMIQFRQKVLPESVDHSAFVMLTDDIIIGLALLKESKSSAGHIRQHYCMYPNTPNMKPVTSCPTALIEEIILVPQFQQNSRFFLREIIRISQFGELFWPMYTQNDMKSSGRSVISTLSHFAPLLKRREMEMNSDLLMRYKLNIDSQDEKAPDAVFCINNVICSFPKIDINVKLVLVGASDAAFSFLKSLLLGPSSIYLTFTSVTLVSTHGIQPVMNERHPVQKMLKTNVNDKFSLSDKRVLESFVNVVSNTMKAIDRKRKFILTDNGGKLHFDLLFLFCGKQYQSPDYLKDIDAPNLRMYSTECVPINVLSYVPPVQNLTPTDGPQNLFMINDLTEAFRSFKELRRFIGKKLNYNVIVYGATIDAYCCINALLEYCIPSTHIVFVEPSPDCNQKEHYCTAFNNEFVDRRVTQTMMERQVKIYQSYNYKSCLIEKDGEKNIISSVKFKSYFEVIDVECVAMFYYGTKDIDKNTFMAINRCGLVYNGGIVIDAEYTTSDSCIYAAGPITQHSKEYKSNRRSIFKYSSEEIGFMFGEKILHSLNPFATKTKTINTIKSEEKLNDALRTAGSKLFDYSNASVFSFDNDTSNSHKSVDFKCHEPRRHPHCPKTSLTISRTLPFGLNYLYVTSPGLLEPIALKRLRHDYGRVIETFLNGYFQLHLDQEGYVYSITCLTEDAIEVNNIKCLWKKHDLLLNKLVYRFEHGQILDFYQYFRQPWAYAIYHDGFDELMEKINKLYHSKYISNGGLLELCNHQNINSFKKSIEDEMVKFLNINSDTLPMYSNSTHAKMSENSKFFQKCSYKY